MGASAIVRVYTPHVEQVVNIYVPHNGYPYDLGLSAANILHEETNNNDMPYIATMLLRHWLKSRMGICLYPPNYTNLGQTYEYYIEGDEQMRCIEWDTQWGKINRDIFNGTAEEFIKRFGKQEI
jgi:hypothetical protein